MVQASALQRALGPKNLAQIFPYLLTKAAERNIEVLQFSEPRAL